MYRHESPFVVIEEYKSVICVILEAAVGCIGHITCSIVGVILGGDHTIVCKALDNSRCYATEAIISIAHFGRICKYL